MKYKKAQDANQVLVWIQSLTVSDQFQLDLGKVFKMKGIEE